MTLIGIMILPKEVTHFALKHEEDKCKIDLDAFYEKYLEPSKIFTRSDSTRSFLWGYYFHLIADCIWVEKYLLPSKRSMMQSTMRIKILLVLCERKYMR